MLAGRVLIVIQVAVSVPLLVGAILFLRTFNNLGRVELGFDPRGLVFFRMDPTLNGYEPDRIARFYDSVREQLEEIPGVTSATLIENTLVSGWISNTQISVDGSEPEYIHMNRVGPRFLETLGLPVPAKNSVLNFTKDAGCAGRTGGAGRGRQRGASWMCTTASCGHYRR